MRTVWTTLGAMVGTGLYALSAQQLSLDFAPLGWLWAALLGIVCTVFGITFLWESVACVGPGPAAIIATSEPLFSVLLSISLLGEAISGLQWLGGILILIGVVLVQMQSRINTPS
jgi:drug/metabolite transporter (DMT)-like permease